MHKNVYHVYAYLMCSGSNDMLYYPAESKFIYSINRVHVFINFPLTTFLEIAYHLAA